MQDIKPESWTSQNNNEDEESNVDEDKMPQREEDVIVEKRNENAFDEEEEDDQNDFQEIFTHNLRDRQKLREPSRFEDYVLSVEDLVSNNHTPETYEEAIRSQQNTQWKEVMKSELLLLKENQTWELVSLPKEEKALPCRWVFRVKTNPDDTIEKYKARLVIKGFNQRQGIDYNQTFSPVTKMSTIRSILSISVTEKMYLAHFDVHSTFVWRIK